jgi:hypothetical protein
MSTNVQETPGRDRQEWIGLEWIGEDWSRKAGKARIGGERCRQDAAGMEWQEWLHLESIAMAWREMARSGRKGAEVIGLECQGRNGGERRGPDGLGRNWNGRRGAERMRRERRGDDRPHKAGITNNLHNNHEDRHMVSKTKTTETVDIIEVNQGIVEYCVLGQSPLICNAMSAKVQQQLLLPPPKKNAAEKASSLKHDPFEEFRSSVYYARSDQAPTLITMKATSFKNAIKGAALDIPGATKSQIGRLTYVVGDEVAIYGIPQIMLSVTRSADINKTPDVRSRAIIPYWACRLSVNFITPILKHTTVTNLLAAAGIMQGIGDWRVQKGSGNYGQFRLVDADDPTFLDIITNGGRAAQKAAMENPESYDSETDQLLHWYESEVKRRGFKAA